MRTSSKADRNFHDKTIIHESRINVLARITLNNICFYQFQLTINKLWFIPHMGDAVIAEVCITMHN